MARVLWMEETPPPLSSGASPTSSQDIPTGMWRQGTLEKETSWVASGLAPQGSMILEEKVVISSEAVRNSAGYQVRSGPVIISVLRLTANNLQSGGGGWRKKEKRESTNSDCRVSMTCLSEQCGKPLINTNNSPPASISVSLKTMS